MRKCLLLMVLFLMSFGLFSQQSDKQLLASKTFNNEKFDYKRKVEYLFKGRNAFVKYNPLSLFFGGSMMLYQSTISVQIGANCPYEVSCSAFSKACIGKYGILKGIALTADRLTRCTRLSAMDLDYATDLNSHTHRIIDDPNNYKRK